MGRKRRLRSCLGAPRLSGWRHGKRQEGEPRTKALGGNRRSVRTEVCHDAVLDALAPAKGAIIEEVPQGLA